MGLNAACSARTVDAAWATSRPGGSTISTPTLALPLTRVLFVDGQDAVASRLAAGLLEQYAGGLVEAGAARTRVDRIADELAATVLADAGLDPSEHQAQPLSAGAIRRADRVISLSTTLDVARIPGPRYETWETGPLGLPDSSEVVERDRRDALARRVQDLAVDLTTPPTPVPGRGARLRGLLGRVVGRLTGR